MIALRYTRRLPFRALILLAAGLVASLPGCVSLPAAKPVGGLVSTPERSLDGVLAPVFTTIPLTMDGNRLYAEVSFRKADGGIRKAMAWVNFGMGGLSLSPSLRRDLGRESSVAFSLGGIPVTVQPGAILAADADDFAQLGPFPVEAILPAVLWPHYRVTLDYAARTLTLAQPSPVPAPGVAVPIEVNEGTGFATVLATVAGQSHPVVLDPGSGYTWWRGSVVRDWLTQHPNWYRANGAVGQSNQAMVDEAFELSGDTGEPAAGDIWHPSTWDRVSPRLSKHHKGLKKKVGGRVDGFSCRYWSAPRMSPDTSSKARWSAFP